MQILIIDDNSEITDMLSFYLGNEGYECKVVNDGKEGLQAIKTDYFDLALKRDNLLEKKKIVVLTASTLNEEDTNALVRDGIKAVLKKPISIEELSSAMKQFG